VTAVTVVTAVTEIAGVNTGSDIARRPDVDPEVLAVLAAAVDQAWPRPKKVDDAPTLPAWRFSGRWWSRPVASRRDRPFG
jgi:uncharacterized protein (DUF2336 family)